MNLKRALTLPLRHTPVAVLLCAALAAVAASLVRDLIIEPEIMGALCRGDTPPLWCGARQALITVNGAGVYGIASLGLAFASLFAKGRWATALVVVAAGFGGAGLFLYNAYLSATGLLLALVRAVRLPEQSPHGEAGLAQPRHGEQR